MTLTTRTTRRFIAHVQTASRKAACKLSSNLKRELAGYPTPAERGDLEATLDRYPYGTTHKLHGIPARPSLADDIESRHSPGTPMVSIRRSVRLCLLIVTVLVAAGCGASTGGGDGGGDGGGGGGAPAPAPPAAASSCPGTPASNINTGDAAGADQAGQGSSPPWAAPSDPSSGLQLAGLTLNTMEGTAQHFHPHLDIIDDGQAIDIPGGIGIQGYDPNTTLGTAYSPIHTHQDDGVIHVESPDQTATYTLGQFFDEWQVPLSDHQIGGLTTDSSNVLCAYVNGQLFSGAPATIQLEPAQEIELYFGPVADIGQIITSPPQICPQIGPSGEVAGCPPQS